MALSALPDLKTKSTGHVVVEHLTNMGKALGVIPQQLHRTNERITRKRQRKDPTIVSFMRRPDLIWNHFTYPHSRQGILLAIFSSFERLSSLPMFTLVASMCLWCTC